MNTRSAKGAQRLRQNAFSAEEHATVQQKIEANAYRYWCANGCRSNTMLDDWLKAENEVVAAFIMRRTRHRTAAQASRQIQHAIEVKPNAPPAVERQAWEMAEAESTRSFGHCL